MCAGRPTPITLFNKSWAVVFGVLEICPATLLLDGCDDDADTSGGRGGDVVAMLMLSLVGLRGLRGLKPPVRPCGVDLLDRIGETVGGDDLHREGRCRVNHDKDVSLGYIPGIPNDFVLLIL